MFAAQPSFLIDFQTRLIFRSMRGRDQDGTNRVSLAQTVTAVLNLVGATQF